MDTILSLISDLIIILFAVSLYIRLTPLKKDTPLNRGLMYGGSSFVVLFYVITTYVLHVPYASASFFCMTIPIFLLFLSLSKYKSARFLVTFCFVDSVTFIIAAVGKIVLALSGTWGGIFSSLVMLGLCAAVYLTVGPYCSRYRALMEEVSQGWTPMAVSTVLIYILLIVASVYPEPMLERLEYIPLYLFLCATILSFYVVFIRLLVQKARLTRANLLLKQQQHWHDLAYSDELTRLANRTACDARIAELEKPGGHDGSYGVLVFDIDNFRLINDTYGHHAGNSMLQKTAQFFQAAFPADHYEFFRVGSDEFAAIVRDLPDGTIRQKVARINAMKTGQAPGCTCSCGYAPVDFNASKPFEQAFLQANQAMYSAKTAKKAR